MKPELTPDQQADQIVEALLTDLQDRAGLSDAWEMNDSDIQEEIQDTWRRIILRILTARHTNPPA